VADKGLFLQNVIAVIWDFDRTLSPHYMQKPLFAAYNVEEAAFWREVHALPAYYKRAGITVQPDTCYLGHLLAYVQAGRMPDLSNRRLRELGAAIVFFPGIPEFFQRLASVLEAPLYREGDLRLEHYVVSTGLAEMIRGSKIAPYIDGVYASEFIETAAGPAADFTGRPAEGPITQIAGLLDNTTKTRALFEINKGVNKHPRIIVNDSIAQQDRRIPFANMIYVADGPSDVPSFSVVRKHGGLAYAVYAPESDEHYAQAVGLQEAGRVNAYGPADYRAGSETDKWLRLQIGRIAARIIEERQVALHKRVAKGPAHAGEGE
jgi:hypothetical protein